MHIDNSSDNNVTKENLSLLIETSTKFLEDHNENVKKINLIRAHRNEKHLKAISALDKRTAKYLKAIRSEQEKISKFKKIALRLGIELDSNNTKPIEIEKEEIEAVNKNTGEKVNLSQEEIDFLRSLSDE